jgi:two-component system chemotaxis response regulator CheY
MRFKNIFVIDDDMVYHFIVKKLFSKCNVTANTSYFFNGLDAIENLKERIENRNDEIPDLILLDINMPVYDGWQFLEEYQKLKDKFNKEITVYLISSSNDTTDINKSKMFGAEVKHYYYKPISIEDFQEIFI